MIQAGLVESAHDCADGGLAVALVESALPAGVGLSVRLPSRKLRLSSCCSRKMPAASY